MTQVHHLRNDHRHSIATIHHCLPDAIMEPKLNPDGVITSYSDHTAVLGVAEDRYLTDGFRQLHCFFSDCPPDIQDGSRSFPRVQQLVEETRKSFGSLDTLRAASAKSKPRAFDWTFTRDGTVIRGDHYEYGKRELSLICEV
jgi:hypothetical protein